jgi:hypothetical protein
MRIARAARPGGPFHEGGPAADQDSADYQRGRRDGAEWARDYATHDELRDLADEFEPGRSAPFHAGHSLNGYINGKQGTAGAHVTHDDTPFWWGFVTGAREVLDETGPLS